MILGFRYDVTSFDVHGPVECKSFPDNRAGVRWMSEPMERGESRKCYVLPEGFNTVGDPPAVLARVWGVGKRLLRNGQVRSAAPQTKEPQGMGVGGQRSAENALNQLKASINEPGVRDALKSLLR